MIRQLIIFFLEIYLRKYNKDFSIDTIGSIHPINDSRMTYVSFETHWSEDIKCFKEGQFVKSPEEISEIRVHEHSILEMCLRILIMKKENNL